MKELNSPSNLVKSFLNSCRAGRNDYPVPFILLHISVSSNSTYDVISIEVIYSNAINRGTSTLDVNRLWSSPLHIQSLRPAWRFQLTFARTMGCRSGYLALVPAIAHLP